MEIGERFRQARKARGLTLNELGAMVGLDSGNISRFETGKQGVSLETLANLMKVLELDFHAPRQISSCHHYPLLKWKAIGSFLKDGNYDGRSIKTCSDAGEGGFWAEVSGDEMFSDHAPSFVAGTRILVDTRNTKLENGGLYVFFLHDQGVYTFRQYVGYDGSSFLRPLKSVYPPVTYPSDALVIGRVVSSNQKGF